MKGVVFNLLNELVEEQFGFSAWENMLTKVGSDGVFSMAQTYPDELLFDLVGAAHELTDIPVKDLVHSLGEFMAPVFARDYPVFFENQPSFKAFLLTVDRVIHVEVRKLYPEAHLPEFDYAEEQDNELVMLYRSPRQLCALAEGLIMGCAKIFEQTYEITHERCMHSGSDHCELKLKFGS